QVTPGSGTNAPLLSGRTTASRGATQGGIDIESAGIVPQDARKFLSEALARDDFSPRNWAIGKGPSDRIVVRYYSSEDEERAISIRNPLPNALREINVQVQGPLNPPQNYRNGHVDIWLPSKAIQLLSGDKPGQSKK